MDTGSLEIPSDAEILERAASFALEGLQAADVQLDRARQPTTTKPGRAFQWWIDLQFFIVALRRLRRAAELASRASRHRDEIRSAIAIFDESLPTLQLLRNVGEHIDDYSLGTGQVTTVGWKQVQVGHWDDPVFRWLDLELDTEAALKSARQLVSVLEAARSQEVQARKR